MLDLKPWKRQNERYANESWREIDNVYSKFHYPDFLSSTIVNSDLRNDSKKFTEVETDTRRHVRKQTEQEVTCTFYNSLEDDFEILDAQVVNRSNSGLLLRSDLPFETGMPVLVRLMNILEKDVQDELKDGVHAKVVRCDRTFAAENGSCYQVAMELFELCQ